MIRYHPDQIALALRFAKGELDYKEAAALVGCRITNIRQWCAPRLFEAVRTGILIEVECKPQSEPEPELPKLVGPGRKRRGIPRA